MVFAPTPRLSRRQRAGADEFVDPYFKGAKPDQIVVILKAREPARIMTAIGDKKLNRWHLQIADQRRQQGGVMRIAEWPLTRQLAAAQPTGDRLDHAEFECLRY